MTKFDTLWDAISYHTHCPFCKSKINVNDRILSKPFDKDDGQIYLLNEIAQYDSMALNLHNDSYCICNIKKDLNRKRNEESHIDYLPSTAKIYRQYQGITFYCNDCEKFAYSIKLELDVENKKMKDISLNSEFICVEEDDFVYEIKNIYATDKMEFYYCNKDIERRENLPIMPLNLTDPKQTLNRIKKLLAFI